MTKITILGATFNNDNLGVGALAVGIVTCITESIGDAEISLLDYAREPYRFEVNVKGRTIPIQTVNVRMKPYVANNMVFLVVLALALRVLPLGIRRWLASKNPVLNHVQTRDVLVSIAGGDSFSDIYGLRRLIDVSLPQILVILLGKELVLLPQTLGPFKGGFAKAVAKFIMKRAAIVFSRDQESLREATAVMGGHAEPGKLRFCHDVGFMMQPQRPEHLDVVGLSLERDEQVPLVGLNISGLLYIGGYKRDDAFGFRDKYIEFSSRVIELMIIGKRARVLLVPHVLGSGSESDSVVCSQLYEGMKTKYPGRIGFVRGSYGTAEMKHIIGQCDFFVGSRMHACIAALSQGVPAVAVSYSRKFVGVLETLGAAELVVDPQVLSTDEILKIIGEKYDARGGIHTLLAAKIPEVRKTLLSLFPEICDRAQRGPVSVGGLQLDSSRGL